MPVLRARVPREQIRVRWLGEQGTAQLKEEVALFQADLQNSELTELMEVNHG
jgi:hypothetical protein